MKKILIASGILLSSFLLSTTLSAQRVVISVRPPAPKRVVIKTPRPGSNYVFINGYWKWNPRRNRYVWVDGRWVKRRPNQVYVTGRWRRVRGGYTWVPGHWKYV